MNFITTITDIVKESGITDIISSYKNQFEWKELIDKYNGNFNKLCANEDLTEEFIDTFFDKIDWNMVSSRDLAYDILDKYQEHINWTIYIYKMKGDISEEILQDFHYNFIGSFEETFKADFDEDREDWLAISSLCNLSDSFLSRHREKIHWDNYLQERSPREAKHLYEDYSSIIQHQELQISYHWREE